MIHRQSRSCEPRTAAGSSKRPPETKPKTAREKPGNQILEWNCEREGEEKEDFNAENQFGTSNNGLVQKKSELLCELYFSKRQIDRSIDRVAPKETCFRAFLWAALKAKKGKKRNEMTAEFRQPGFIWVAPRAALYSGQMKFVNRFCVSFLCPFFLGNFLFSCGGLGGKGKGRREGNDVLHYRTGCWWWILPGSHVQLGMCTPGRIRRLHPAVMQEPLLKHSRLRGERYRMH